MTDKLDGGEGRKEGRALPPVGGPGHSAEPEPQEGLGPDGRVSHSADWVTQADFEATVAFLRSEDCPLSVKTVLGSRPSVLSVALARHRQASTAALLGALEQIVEACSNTGIGNPIVSERVIDRCDDIARAAIANASGGRS